jgi:hypothetical protein
LLSPEFLGKRGGHETKWGNFLSANPEDPNVNVLRSVWRRLKNDIKAAIIRDLQPRKDVKGGGDVKSESKPTTGDTGTRRGY